jgi:hypothetical protein
MDGIAPSGARGSPLFRMGSIPHAPVFSRAHLLYAGFKL